MSKLKLSIVITPLSDKVVRKMYELSNNIHDTKIKNMLLNKTHELEERKKRLDKERVKDIIDYLVEKIMDHLLGGQIPVEYNQKSYLERPSSDLIRLIKVSNIRKSGISYISSITIDSDYASFVEFGTGMHSELSPKHFIYPKKYRLWSGGVQQGSYLHWMDDQGNMFLAKSAGQYPKPFLRGAVMRLNDNASLVEGYKIETEIIFPISAKFSTTVEGEELHSVKIEEQREGEQWEI